MYFGPEPKDDYDKAPVGKVILIIALSVAIIAGLALLNCGEAV